MLALGGAYDTVWLVRSATDVAAAPSDELSDPCLVSEFPELLTDAEYTAVADAIRGHGWVYVDAPGPRIAAEATGVSIDRIEAYLDRCFAYRSEAPEVLSDADAKTVARYRLAVVAANGGKPAPTPPPGVEFADWVAAETGISADAIRTYARARLAHPPASVIG